ncbi:hypothetical protein SISNIDRAFT_454498 [Sistotremastrum niveocremeum HHB9708]|uniref:Uncharacterized protein n=1 Tax=Sistotremastrum niveocremeum HHB9708 TaxID=1314777 RepID=A0A164UL97_9AGAM|nr:hypothetical protein SISNIDRAFT_454498 [Sistotremastrum niveocremeum HHB9708]
MCKNISKNAQDKMRTQKYPCVISLASKDTSYNREHEGIISVLKAGKIFTFGCLFESMQACFGGVVRCHERWEQGRKRNPEPALSQPSSSPSRRRLIQWASSTTMNVAAHENSCYLRFRYPPDPGNAMRCTLGASIGRNAPYPCLASGWRFLRCPDLQ